MFLCKECHDEELDCAWWHHIAKSYGKCEQCLQVSECVDCAIYKKSAEEK